MEGLQLLSTSCSTGDNPKMTGKRLPSIRPVSYYLKTNHPSLNYCVFIFIRHFWFLNLQIPWCSPLWTHTLSTLYGSLPKTNTLWEAFLTKRWSTLWPNVSIHHHTTQMRALLYIHHIILVYVMLFQTFFISTMLDWFCFYKTRSHPILNNTLSNAYKIYTVVFVYHNWLTVAFGVGLCYYHTSYNTYSCALCHLSFL